MMNQCDGCQQGADTKPGQFDGFPMHIDRYGRGFMTCQREKYAELVTCLSCGAKAESAKSLPCGH